eukprot:scaffold18513_cov101-Isochrysis_galbana.AAC.6
MAVAAARARSMQLRMGCALEAVAAIGAPMAATPVAAAPVAEAPVAEAPVAEAPVAEALWVS